MKKKVVENNLRFFIPKIDEVGPLHMTSKNNHANTMIKCFGKRIYGDLMMEIEFIFRKYMKARSSQRERAFKFIPITRIIFFFLLLSFTNDEVYLADYKSQYRSIKDCTLACKIIDTSKAPKDFVRKFLPRELDILVKINHPHVVHIHSIFQRRTKYFIFMRFAENGDLLDYILKNGAVSENQARIWLRQLALGLQYLHEMEIAHRDMKCENVLLTTNYNVKLADFGFSRYMIDNRGKRVLSDTYCGSLSYAAPEVLRGTPYDPKISDVWSLGVILYITLNKAMPFDETNIKILYEQQLSRRWKFRRKVDENISESGREIVTNLLEPDIQKRWQVDQILFCNWIAMDPRLLILTPAEQTALNNAIEERKRNEEKFSKKKSSRIEKKQQNISETVGQVTILKGASKARTSSLLPTVLKNLE